MDFQGKHVTCDVWLTGAIPYDILQIIERGIAASGMNVVNSCLHNFGSIDALTCVWVLAESHFTVHTYPEHSYLSMDCYTCGQEGEPLRAIDTILADLAVDHVTIRQLKRGEKADAKSG